MCDASSDPTTYDHPSDHETRVSEAAAAVAAIPKRPRVMRVSGEPPVVAGIPRCPHGAPAWTCIGADIHVLDETGRWPEMAASDYPDEPRTPSRWERVRDVLRSIRWTW